MHTCMMVWGYKNVHLYICNLYGKCVIYFSSVSWKLYRYHMLYLLKSYKQYRHTVTATWRLHLCVHVKYGIQMKQLNEFRNVRAAIVSVRSEDRFPQDRDHCVGNGEEPCCAQTCKKCLSRPQLSMFLFAEWTLYGSLTQLELWLPCVNVLYWIWIWVKFSSNNTYRSGNGEEACCAALLFMTSSW